jgi:hypothetical protein
MNIDRRTFRTTHPAYTELQQVVHHELRAVLSRARKELYGAGSAERRTARARKESERLTNVLTTRQPELGTSSARQVRRTWLGEATQVSEGQQTSDLLRKYSLAELYEICIEAAAEVLDREQLRKFVGALTRRLRQK